MASLLDFVLQNQQGPMRLLDGRNRMASLFDGAAPAESPDIFNPGQPASLPQLSAAAGMQGQPQSPVPDVQMQDTVRDAARRQTAQQLAQAIASINGGRLPERSINWIDETSREAQSGPGQPGRGFLARLYLGDVPEGLSKEQVTRLRKQAMIMAGLHMLARPHGTSVGQALAAGILFGRSHATQTMGAMLDEQQATQRTQERYSLLSDTGMSELERWQEIQRRAVAEGDMDSAKQAQDIIKDLRDLAAGEAEEKFQQINGQTFVVDAKGRVLDPFSREVLTEAPPADSELVNVMTPAGQMTFRQGSDGALYDPFTGQQVRAAPQPAPEAPEAEPIDPKRTAIAEKAVKSRNNLGVISSHLNRLIEANPDNPLKGIRFDRKRFEQTGVLGVIGSQRHKLDSDTQLFLQAQEAFMIELANQLAGVRGISQEQARQAIYRAYGFEEGDSVANVRHTLRELETGVRSLELQAGPEALEQFRDLRAHDEDDEDEGEPDLLEILGRL